MSPIERYLNSWLKSFSFILLNEIFSKTFSINLSLRGIVDLRGLLFKSFKVPVLDDHIQEPSRDHTNYNVVIVHNWESMMGSFWKHLIYGPYIFMLFKRGDGVLHHFLGIELLSFISCSNQQYWCPVKHKLGPIMRVSESICNYFWGDYSYQAGDNRIEMLACFHDEYGNTEGISIITSYSSCHSCQSICWQLLNHMVVFK